MKTQEWRSYFSPQEWVVFNREAARRGISADELAAKYLCRAIDRMELAEKHNPDGDANVARAIRRLRRTPPKNPFHA